jgi:hypothetical protein
LLAANLDGQGRSQDAAKMMDEWQKLADQTDPNDREFFFERLLGAEFRGLMMARVGDFRRARAFYAEAVRLALAADQSGAGSAPADMLYSQAINFYRCDDIEAGDKAWAESQRIRLPFNQPEITAKFAKGIASTRKDAQARLEHKANASKAGAL